jgi:exonuclease-1
MGIQGLLPQLKSIMAPIGVEALKGQTVAVDTYSWLHKGALSCGDRLCKGLPTTRFGSGDLPPFLGTQGFLIHFADW